MQQSIQFSFQKDILGDIIELISFPYATLNNEKVNLSFKPAAQADEDALAALIPADITDVNQLPTAIPSSIYVIPELKVNGAIVKTGGAMQIGAELPFITAINFAGRGYMRTPREYKVIAGSFLNVNVFAGSVSPKKLEKLQAKLEQTKLTLESANQTEIAALTRDDILGDMFYAGGLGYYAQLLSLSYISGLKSKSYFQLASGYGTIGYEPEVNSKFGQPLGIKTGGVAFDIPIIYVTASSDGDAIKKIQFTKQIGTLGSALEHITPEQMFAPTDPNAPKPDAISAVKALQKASQAGQKIYQITQANMNQVLPLLNHHSETIDEIRRALQAGKEVTTHTDAVSIPGGWSGFGYIVIDTETGAGAYKISGGLNGSIHHGRNKGKMKSLMYASVSSSISKNLLFSLLDYVFTKPLFGFVDFIIGIFSQFKQLRDACDDGEYLAAATLIGVMSTIALGAIFIAPFGLGLIFALTLPLIIDQILNSSLSLCSNLAFNFRNILSRYSTVGI